jgi:hypothetical protein
MNGLELPKEFPGRNCADHEIFMSFNNDSDAEIFRDWWESYGEAEFWEHVSTRQD